MCWGWGPCRFDANFNTGILFFYPVHRAEAFIGEWTQTQVHSGANIHGQHIWDDQHGEVGRECLRE